MRYRSAFALLSVAVAVAMAGCGSGQSGPSAPPKPASQLSSEANGIVGGGRTAFQKQLDALRGTPVVVNQWASWCGPCRFEFPFFARLSRSLHGRVAFLGVDSQDGRSDAQRFLRKFPVPYPSFFDPDTSIARVFKGGQAWPTTAFYDAKGKLRRTHPGAYASQAKLEQDIRTYALRAG